MQDLIGNNGSFNNVPVIPMNLITTEQVAMIIPEGFEDVMSYQIKKDAVHITLVNDEYQDNEIIIPSSVYNPQGNLVEFPRFLLERTIVQGKNIDYFTDESDRYILNQNELLYVVLQHRFLQFLGRANVYSNLLKQDVSAVASFMSHVPSVAYNSVTKNHNSYIIMNVYDTDGSFKRGRTLGDIIRSKSYLPDAEGWEKLRGCLEIQCSSESGASEVGKLILSPYAKGSLYRSVGHKIYFNTALNIYMMKSLFKSAQNITARNKTHVTANAFEIYDFKPTSNFIEDWVYDSKAPTNPPVIEGYLPKDACYVRALSVIRPINTETDQYLFGEVEASEEFYDTYVWEDQKVIDVFDRMVLPKDGTVVYAEPAYELDESIGKGFEVSKYKPILIGYHEDETPILLRDVKAVKYIKEKLLGGPLGKSRLTLRVARKAGNARCDSNTGFKGVTKGKPYLGKIVFEDGTEMKPMLAFGMNSFKAKHNGIELARAALSVDMCTYKPKHWSGKLNSFDEVEINTASQSLPSYVYYDEFGNKHDNVEIGVIYYRYTELGETFKSYKKQSFSHEAGRNLYHNDNNDLFHFLWDNYVDHDMKDALVELQKTLTSSDSFDGDSKLPYYTPAMIQAVPKKGQEPLFDIDKDLFTSMISNFKSSSKILKDEFNPNGFFLDFRAQRGPLVRVPSAKTLRLFENELETGEWRYHRAFLSLSKMIRNVIYKNLRYVFLKPGEKHRDTHSYRYLRDIKGIIFTSDDSKEMNVTTLSRPMVPGFAMKQSVEVLLPPHTALIMCDKAYKRALIECYGEEDHELHHLMYGLHGLHVRAPS